MLEARRALTPDALALLEAIATTGSFAAAARQLGKVPSAVTYSVRQLEDALDVLLFDRRSRQARLTAAGQELLDEGGRLLEQMEAVANRVKRVASGWETQLSIAVDDVVSSATMLELCEAFYACSAALPQAEAGRGRAPPSPTPPATRLRLRTEVLAGTWEALLTGRADLAIGVAFRNEPQSGIAVKELGTLPFVFAVSPRHPLAGAAEPLADSVLLTHRAVAVADSAKQLSPMTVNLLPGQDVLTVADMRAKIDALARGLGCGFAPEPMVREHVAAGSLVVKAVQRHRLESRLGYAWRTPVASRQARKPPLGLALRWWLGQLDSVATRTALLERHGANAATAAATARR